MSKFEICATINVERCIKFEVEIGKRAVVEALGLEGDDAKEWEDRIVDYLSDEDIFKQLASKAEVETTEEIETHVSVDSADLMD